MLSKIIKLLVVLLIANATWRIGVVYVAHYKLEDAIQQLAQFEIDRDVEAIRARIMDEAARLGLPVDAERVSVRKEGEHLYIDVTYTVPIEVLPRVTRPWNFVINAHGWYVPGGRTPIRR